MTRVQGRTGTRVCSVYVSLQVGSTGRRGPQQTVRQPGTGQSRLVLDFVNLKEVSTKPSSQYFSSLCMSNYLHKNHLCKNLM